MAPCVGVHDSERLIFGLHQAMILNVMGRAVELFDHTLENGFCSAETMEIKNTHMLRNKKRSEESSMQQPTDIAIGRTMKLHDFIWDKTSISSGA